PDHHGLEHGIDPRCEPSRPRCAAGMVQRLASTCRGRLRRAGKATPRKKTVLDRATVHTLRCLSVWRGRGPTGTSEEPRLRPAPMIYRAILPAELLQPDRRAAVTAPDRAGNDSFRVGGSMNGSVHRAFRQATLYLAALALLAGCASLAVTPCDTIADRDGKYFGRFFLGVATLGLS